MGKLILITGDLASGKTTFSEKLSKRYNINTFQKDSVKEVLGETIGFSNREENLKLSGATMELMLFLFQKFAVLDKSLILEANFHKEEIDRFLEIASTYRFEVLILVLRGDISVLHKRYLNRIQNECRHPVHLSAFFDDMKDFTEYIEHSRKEQIAGNTMMINATDFSYQEDVELLAKIDEFVKQESHVDIKKITGNKKEFLDLLLLADESETMVDKYLERGDMFVLEDNGVKAECVVTKEADGVFELKNIAVKQECWRKGYGKKLIEYLFSHCLDCNVMYVGTGDCYSSLSFYKSCGFKESHRVKNFFVDNYDHLMFEDGVQLVDMVYLKWER